MTNEVKVKSKAPEFPRRLDIIDMPTDEFNVTGTLRKALCKVVNYCRPYPAKMKVLHTILVYTLERMEQIVHLDEQEAAKRAQRLEKEAKEKAEASTKAPEPAPEPQKAPATNVPVGGQAVSSAGQKS